MMAITSILYSIHSSIARLTNRFAAATILLLLQFLPFSTFFRRQYIQTQQRFPLGATAVVITAHLGCDCTSLPVVWSMESCE